MILTRIAVGISLLLPTLLVAACSRAIAPIEAPGASAVALTSGPNTSMIYLARTSDGLLAIDLGWWGHERPLKDALAELGAKPADVRHVFITHSHRDHISGWQAVRTARFHLAAPERALLVGDSAHGAAIPRVADRIKRPSLPGAHSLEIATFSRDTVFVFGADTLRAYLVPGHTSGSAVYVFRGVLFLGDAVGWSYFGGFGPAKRIFTDDRDAAEANLAELWPKIPGDVRYACTAHARCAPYDARFRTAASR